MTVYQRRFPLLSIAAFALLGPAAAGQTVLVTGRSLNDLADDLAHLMKAVAPPGDEQAVQATLGPLNRFRSGQMVKGLDRGRVFGVAVSLPRDFPRGGPTSIVAAVPVSDFREFLDSLAALGFAVNDQPGDRGFTHLVGLPNGKMRFFVLESRRYALFSMVAAGADKLRALDPESWSKRLRPGADLIAYVRVSEIPQALKDQFLNQMTIRLGPRRRRQPGEDESEYQGRLAGQELGLRAIKALARDGDALALDLAVNRKTSEASMELYLMAKPGTATAKDLRAFGQRRSRFEGLGRDAALSAWARVPVAGEFATMMIRISDRSLEGNKATAKSPAEKQLIDRFAELVRSNLKAAEADFGLSIRRSAATGSGDPSYVVLGGMGLKDGRQAERLLRQAIAKEKPEGGVEIHLDVARAADGTAIHRVTGPLDKMNEDLSRQFGKATLAVAFRADTLSFAFGEDSTDALKKTLDVAATARAPRSEGPVAMTARMTGLADLFEKDREALRHATTETFKGAAAGHDRVSLVTIGEGDGLRLRLSMDLPALKLLVMLGNGRKN